MERLGKPRELPNEPAKTAPRAAVAWRVKVKTFGSRHFFDVVTDNVSESGLLVNVDDPRINAPFQTKTLLELEIDADGQLFKEPVKLVGVVIRSVKNTKLNRKEKFGIRIVEASDEFDYAVTRALEAV